MSTEKRKNDIVIGFDLGSECGVAVHYPSGVGKLWSLDTVNYKGPSPATGKMVNMKRGHGHRAQVFYKSVIRTIENIKFSVEEGQSIVVVYEEVKRWQGSDAAHVYGMMRGILLLCAWQCGINTICSYTPSAVKKTATGKGNATKDEMIKAYKDKLSGLFPHKEQVLTDDMADAAWLVYHHLNA